MPKQRDDQEPKRRSHSPRGSDSDRHRRNRDDTLTVAPEQPRLSDKSIPSLSDSKLRPFLDPRQEMLQEAGSSLQPHDQWERNSQGVLQQDAQQQQFRSPFESRQVAQQFLSERDAPPRHETSDHDTPTVPIVEGMIKGPYKPRKMEGQNISMADKITCLEMRRDYPKCKYETISNAIGGRHKGSDLEKFYDQQMRIRDSEKKHRESQQKTMKP